MAGTETSASLSETYRAHRVAYVLAKGAIPEGLVLDHLCRTPACVNPDHLEPVTNHENILRGNRVIHMYEPGKECAAGHVLTITDIAMSKGKPRGCLICLREQRRDYMREYMRKRYQAKREE
jgi:hypothetical protein